MSARQLKLPITKVLTNIITVSKFITIQISCSKVAVLQMIGEFAREGHRYTSIENGNATPYTCELEVELVLGYK